MTDRKYQVRFVRRNSDGNSEVIEIWEFDQFTHESHELIIHALYDCIDRSADDEVVVARVIVNGVSKYSYSLILRKLVLRRYSDNKYYIMRLLYDRKES